MQRPLVRNKLKARSASCRSNYTTVVRLLSYRFIVVTLNVCFPKPISRALLGSLQNAALKCFPPAATGASLKFRPRKLGRKCSWRDKYCVGVLLPGTQFRSFCMYQFTGISSSDTVNSTRVTCFFVVFFRLRL
jgi:hypothetical protein